jgi:hypothetical protein
VCNLIENVGLMLSSEKGHLAKGNSGNEDIESHAGSWCLLKVEPEALLVKGRARRESAPGQGWSTRKDRSHYKIRCRNGNRAGNVIHRWDTAGYYRGESETHMYDDT